MIKISIISLFPQVLEAYLKIGMLAKAQTLKVVEFNLMDLRDFGLGQHQQVDDTPYGGGGGMVLRIEPLVEAIEVAQKQSRPEVKVILLTPKGQVFKQSIAQTLADNEFDLILIGGRYEGYDERITHWVDQQISIGAYILTGFELPALVLADAMVRLLPRVLGCTQTLKTESFTTTDSSLTYPQYTKPAVFRQLTVPEVLLRGNHQQIADWRARQIKKI